MCENFSLTWSTLGRRREGSLVWVRVERDSASRAYVGRSAWACPLTRTD